MGVEIISTDFIEDKLRGMISHSTIERPPPFAKKTANIPAKNQHVNQQRHGHHICMSNIAHAGKLGGGCVLGLSRSSPGAVIPEPAVSVGKGITPSNEGSAILISRFWLRFSARVIFLLSPA